MIEVKDVTKQFANETVIRYNDMIFESGKSYMLLGASGCGKSTLLNMIAGALSPENGSILIDGFDISAAAQKDRDSFRIHNIGYIFQDFKLIPEMTVMDNINILKLERVNTSDAENILSRLGILDKKSRKVGSLSGGERQRVAIARALVKKPNIVLADEPTGNLNFAIGKAVIEELVSAAKDKTLIVVTHDDRLSDYFDVVVNMNEVTGGRQDV